MRDDPPATASNADNLKAALDLLARLIRGRMKQEPPAAELALSFYDDGSPLGEFIRDRQPSAPEWVTLMLALAPHARPGLIDAEIRAALKAEGDFPEIGGVREPDSRTFLPTGQTAVFLVAGDDLEGRFAIQRLFGPDHWFAREGVLRLEPPRDGAPALAGRLVMARDWAERLTLGRAQPPAFGPDFPARRIETALDWQDLVLPEGVRVRLDELLRWALHHRALSGRRGLGARLRPGCRALFHGASGTGKTFAATLLGKATGREVFRVDLSVVVSKYIGETEKNLSGLFAAAQRRDWILFFDEADALFGKRTSVRDSHDRYANQEVSYLLQRIEDYDGLCILASNLRANIDDAFLRRFNFVIRFPEPGPEERAEIWRRTLPGDDPVARERLVESAKGYDLTGGAIVNAAQFAAIEAIAAGRAAPSEEDLELGVQREIEKEGRVFRAMRQPRSRAAKFRPPS
jgi:hypothetical protein